MDSAILKTLEYHKIIDMLAARTGSVWGRELAEALVPVSDLQTVEQYLAETSEAVEIILTAVNVPLGGVRDIRIPLKRAQIGSILEISDFLAISSTLYAARRMKTFFADYEKPLTALAPVIDSIQIQRPLEILIENTVTEQGQIRDTASVELARLRREIRLFQARIKDRLDHILHSSEYQKYFQEALVTVRGDRYVIPVKQECRHQFPGIVHDQSASGATVFMEPMVLVQLNNDMKQAMAAERHEVDRILLQLSSQVARLTQPILETCQALAQLDFAFAKAKLGIDLKAERPLLNQHGYVKLLAARHPLIDPAHVVPIDVHIGKEFTTLLITGPNTGGKTVSLKTVGLFALMTQAGLFIPAKATSEMPLFTTVFADIGDEQSIEHSLSTFSGHMTNLVRILNQVGQGDLVLIDEIGAGTDPSEGAALAMSILEYLHTIGARTIATTHYSELKTFAYSRQGIENASVEFNADTLRPTYRLLIGVPGSSNAFNISLRLGLKQAIITRARELIDEEHAEFETVLASLENKQREYEERTSHATVIERDALLRQEKLNRDQQEWEEKKRAIITKAQEQAAALIREARRDAEAVIEELKAQFAVQSEKDRQQAITGARKRLAQSWSKTMTDDEGEEWTGHAPLPSQLEPGTTVFVTSLRQKGIVQAVNSGQVTVQLGIMKVNVPLSACRLTGNEAVPNKKSSRKTIDVSKVQDISREVDLRGLTVAEAEEILDKYLDDAVLAGLAEARIIHGKGTGALRKGIKSYLAAHTNITGQRLGDMAEGGDGVTVVKLK